VQRTWGGMERKRAAWPPLRQPFPTVSLGAGLVLFVLLNYAPFFSLGA
jgi:hypothetical protein